MMDSCVKNFHQKRAFMRFFQMTFFSIMTILCSAQDIMFIEVAENQNINFTYGITQFGNGISFYDFDKDGWDDLTVSRPFYETIIYKNVEGIFYSIAQIPSGQETKSVIWVDLDNNGLCDLLTTSKDQGVKIFRNIDNTNFEELYTSIDWTFNSEYNLWGAACSDINFDGLLDIHISNYNINADNLTFINQGNFVFNLVEGLFSPNYQRHSFQSSFIPINEDIIPDLYVINDFSEGNNCYLSQDSGLYVDNATNNGLDVPSDAMSNSWSDFDHDGDWDVYITNRSIGNNLMINDGNGIFSNEAPDRNCTINQWCWSGLWIDYDNDGWEDLWVTNEVPSLNSINVGNHLLKSSEGIFSETPITTNARIDGYTSAKGDFNNDGLYDIAFQPKEYNKLRLLENNIINTNHHIKITLNGIYSNNQGVGSIIQYYHGGLFSQNIIQMGENYLNQNSQHLILGMDTDTIMDSLIVRWPSGITDRYYNLPSDTSYTFIEAKDLEIYTVSMVDSCAADSGFFIYFNSDFNIYPIDSIAQNLGSNIYWVPSSGNWDFLHGIFHTIKVPITIEIDAPYTPLLSTIMPTCADSEDGQIAWYTPNGIWDNYLDSLNAGQYTVEIEFGQCILSDTLLLEAQEILILDSVHVQPAACVSLENGSMSPYYSTNSSNVIWAIGDSAINGNLAAGSYAITLTSAAGCQISDTVNIPLQIELPSFSGVSAFFCTLEHLNYESFTEQWLFNEWTLTSWEINATEDSILIQYMHPNGCVVEHAMVLEWITPPNPSVDTLSEPGSEFVQWEVTNNDSLPFDIYWEDGSTEWQNLYPCNDSTYFVLEYQDICAWTFPLYTICLETSIPQSSEDSMTWTFCSGSVYAQQHFNEEIWIYNALGQTLFWGLAKSHIPLEFSAQPRWVKTRDKIYPIQWCAED
jgi:hypothetical protein